MSQDLQAQLRNTLGAAYRLERELGGGGMSRVFLAHEVALGRRVVVKVLLPELAAGVSVERFRREIQLAAQLQHPHIVPLLSAGESDGLPYFTMPFIAGESLQVKLARTGELPVSETVRILRDVASALAYAHDNGVMHRDVKPGNVLLSGGVAVVTDFGVAKAISASTHSGAPNLTTLGVALGTPAYMAPEQASGDLQIDHRADLYSLGVMTYEMLAGRTPFSGRPTMSVLAAHVVEAPEPIDRLRPAVHPILATLVMQCLAKRPADRPQSAAEVINVLDAISTPTGGTVPTAVVTPVPAGAPRSRSRAPVLSAAAAVGVVVVAAGLFWLRGARKPTVAAPPPGVAGSGAAGVVSVPAPPGNARPPIEQVSPAPTTPAPAPPSPAPRAAVPTKPARPARTTGPAPAPAEQTPPVHPGDRPQHEAAAPGPAPAPPESAPGAVPTPATPLPRSPAPTPVESQAPPVPQPAPDPQPEIRGVLAEYSSAVESQNVANIRRVYPGMTAGQQRSWEQFFETVREVKAHFSVASLDVSNGTAEAQMTGTYTYLNSSTRLTEQQPAAFHVSLRLERGAWRISQVR